MNTQAMWKEEEIAVLDQCVRKNTDGGVLDFDGAVTDFLKQSTGRTDGSVRERIRKSYNLPLAPKVNPNFKDSTDALEDSKAELEFLKTMEKLKKKDEEAARKAKFQRDARERRRLGLNTGRGFVFVKPPTQAKFGTEAKNDEKGTG